MGFLRAWLRSWWRHDKTVHELQLEGDVEYLTAENEKLRKDLARTESENRLQGLEIEKLMEINERDRRRVQSETELMARLVEAQAPRGK